MQAFVQETGVVAPLDRVDVDTDQIIPKQFLKRIERTGFGQFLFFDWIKDPSFVLNNPAYKGASIIVSGRNFGCGSSREHAPWALQDYGFKVVIAPSFGDIFFNNSFKNGMLPIVLPEQTVNEILARAKERPGYKLTVDLERQVVSDEEGEVAKFEVDPYRRNLLLNGLDDIGLTLKHEDEISAYERKQPERLRGLTTAGAA
jgi:3-isopropylmalate/(R)-2-methylmalate dehydratase small subunit